eukprot:Lankesteria_metandrocarpae@DN782_c0_g1_i1.p1
MAREKKARPRGYFGSKRSAPKRSRTSRLTDLLRALPVVAVMMIGLLIYFVYLILHLAPLLQFNVSPEDYNSTKRKRGIIEFIIFHVLMLLFVTTYTLTVITPAGNIPPTPEWKMKSTKLTKLPQQHTAPEDAAQAISTGTEVATTTTTAARRAAPTNLTPRRPPDLLEHKKTGDARHCKWCRLLKPDRAHHCRVCRGCVLRMDHHCPWVYNCIGWGNHKYFVNLVFYTSMNLVFTITTQSESIRRAINDVSVPFGNLFLLLFSESLGALLAFVSTAFLFFHMWLISRDMSTIEFCEKNFRRSKQPDRYDLGVLTNFRKALGPNFLLWFIPIDNRTGDGIHFELSSRRDRVGFDVESGGLLSSSSMEDSETADDDGADVTRHYDRSNSGGSSGSNSKSGGSNSNSGGSGRGSNSPVIVVTDQELNSTGGTTPTGISSNKGPRTVAIE